MDLLGFMKESNFKADARETIKRMKWNNSLKRKLKTENCDNDTVTLTTEEVIEFLESVYQMFVKIRAKPTIITEKIICQLLRVVTLKINRAVLTFYKTTCTVVKRKLFRKQNHPNHRLLTLILIT
uniref:Uncharacterized protein n=1 Tax=Pieris brassicae granulosis virus TaxID=10465 RepID=A0A7G9U8K7_GVPB|nr:hypothetical protein [Pieris brassicae granulovirus]